MGVFFGGSDRPVGHNSSFLDNTAPTQRGNDVAIIIATTELQCATYIDVSSVRQAAQKNM